MSRFSEVHPGAPIEAFDVITASMRDTSENKQNLVIGGYRCENGQPWVLPVVRRVEKELMYEGLDKTYMYPVSGSTKYTEACTRLLLGPDSPAILENRAFGVLSLAGTGALRIGADFLTNILGYKVFYCSMPTWRSHTLIFKTAGFKESRHYRYLSEDGTGLDIEGMLEDLGRAPEDSVVILQPCVHNPTGLDPTKEDWARIADVMEMRRLFPFFDSAFQGFLTGEVEEDAWAVRYFVERGFELFCAQSFSKNFGLYGERVGNLVVVLKDGDPIPRMKHRFEIIIRFMYLGPPALGAAIVERILTTPALFSQWKEQVKTMFERLAKTRTAFRTILEELGTPGDWSQITRQSGMTCSLPLSAPQCEYLAQKHHVYMLSSGRMSICAINCANINYVARAIHDTVTAC